MTSHVDELSIDRPLDSHTVPPFQSVLYWAASTATQYHIPGGKAIPIPEQAGLSPNSPFHPQSGHGLGVAGPDSPHRVWPSVFEAAWQAPWPVSERIVGCEAGLAFYYRVGVSLGGHDARLCKWGLENRTMTVQVLL